MQIVNIQHTIRKTLQTASLPKYPLWSLKAEYLILFTGAAESDYKRKKQLGGGPARSYWQMEPATAIDNFKNFLNSPKNYKLKLKILIASDMENISFELKPHIISNLLFDNQKFSICMCRLKYFRDPGPIPGKIEPMAQYWKRIYNTPRGHGRITDFVKKARHTLDLLAEETALPELYNQKNEEKTCT